MVLRVTYEIWDLAHISGCGAANMGQIPKLTHEAIRDIRGAGIVTVSAIIRLVHFREAWSV